MKKLRVWGMGIMALVMTFLTVTNEHLYASEKKSVSLTLEATTDITQPELYFLQKREWTVADIFQFKLLDVNNNNAVVQEVTVTKNDLVDKNKAAIKFELKDLEVGKSYNYKIEEEPYAIEDLRSVNSKPDKYVDISLDKDNKQITYKHGKVAHTKGISDGEVVKLDSLCDGSATFPHVYYRDGFNIQMMTSLKMNGHVWERGIDKVEARISYTDEDTGEMYHSTEETLHYYDEEPSDMLHSMLRLQPVKDVDSFKAERTVRIDIELLNKTNELIPSEDKKKNTAAVWIKYSDSENDGIIDKWEYKTSDDSAFTSFRQSKDIELPVLELNYYTRNLEIERDVDHKSVSTYDVYRVYSGEASVENDDKRLVKTLTTTDGIASGDFGYGRYFVVETQAPQGFEKTKEVYEFEVNKGNYHEAMVWNIPTKSDTPSEPEEDQPVVDQPEENKPADKPEINQPEENKPENKPTVDQPIEEGNLPVKPEENKPETILPAPEKQETVTTPSEEKKEEQVVTGDNTIVGAYAFLGMISFLALAVLWKKKMD